VFAQVLVSALKVRRAGCVFSSGFEDQLLGPLASCFQYGDWPYQKRAKLPHHSRSLDPLAAACLMDTAPQIAVALCMVGEEAVAWDMAGTKVLPYRQDMAAE
jgi:hypothetical protein